jgi:hypothetical protein
VFKEFVDRESDVFRYLPKQGRRDIAARVTRNRRAAPGTVPKLLMRTTLSHFHKAQPVQNGDDLSWFQDRNLAHGILGNADVLDAHEFRF